MKREDVIRIAKECGLFECFGIFEGSPAFNHDVVAFERFANLVAAAARAEERERCLKACLSVKIPVTMVDGRPCDDADAVIQAIAAAISSDEANEGAE